MLVYEMTVMLVTCKSHNRGEQLQIWLRNRAVGQWLSGQIYVWMEWNGCGNHEITHWLGSPNFPCPSEILSSLNSTLTSDS